MYRQLCKKWHRRWYLISPLIHSSRHTFSVSLMSQAECPVTGRLASTAAHRTAARSKCTRPGKERSGWDTPWLTEAMPALLLRNCGAKPRTKRGRHCTQHRLKELTHWAETKPSLHRAFHTFLWKHTMLQWQLLQPLKRQFGVLEWIGWSCSLLIVMNKFQNFRNWRR